MAKKQTTSKKKSSSPSIGISASNRKTACQILGSILSDQHVLYLKTRNFHWNLIGGRFHTLHVHFEEMYDQLATAIDETAERIRMLGGVSPGSMKELLSGATLRETSGALIDGDSAIEALLSDHETVIKSLRKDIGKLEESVGDVGTADFLTELLQQHEETAWMLRSYLEVSGA